MWPFKKATLPPPIELHSEVPIEPTPLEPLQFCDPDKEKREEILRYLETLKDDADRIEEFFKTHKIYFRSEERKPAVWQRWRRKTG